MEATPIAVKDKDGKPKIKFRKHQKGKKKGQVLKDENGKPLPFYAKRNGQCQVDYTYKRIYQVEYEPEIDPKTKKPKIDPKTKKPVEPRINGTFRYIFDTP